MNKYQQEDKTRLPVHQQTFGMNNRQAFDPKMSFQYKQQQNSQGYDTLSEEPFSIRQILMRLDQLESQAKSSVNQQKENPNPIQSNYQQKLQEYLKQKVQYLENEIQQMKHQEQKYENLIQQTDQLKQSLEGRILIFDEKIVALGSRVDNKLNSFLEKIQDQFPSLLHKEGMELNTTGQIEINHKENHNIKSNDYLSEINNLYKLIRKNLQAQKELFEELNMIKKTLINNNMAIVIPQKTTPEKNDQIKYQQTQNISQFQNQQQPRVQKYSQGYYDDLINNSKGQNPDPQKQFSATSEAYYKKKPQHLSSQENSHPQNKQVLGEKDVNNQTSSKETNRAEDVIDSAKEFDIVNFKKSKQGSVDYNIKYYDRSDRKKEQNHSQIIPQNKLNMSSSFINDQHDNKRDTQFGDKQAQNQLDERKRKIDEEINRRIQEENDRRDRVIVKDKENTIKIQENQQKESFKNTPMGTDKSREKEILNRLTLERRMKEEKIQLYSGIQKQNNTNHTNQYQPQSTYQASTINNSNSFNYQQDQKDNKSPLRMKTLY